MLFSITLIKQHLQSAFEINRPPKIFVITSYLSTCKSNVLIFIKWIIIQEMFSVILPCTFNCQFLISSFVKWVY